MEITNEENLLSDIKVGQEISYNSICAKKDSNKFEESSIGNLIVGEELMFFKSFDKTISFLLIGATDNEYVYKCVYSDYQKPVH